MVNICYLKKVGKGSKDEFDGSMKDKKNGAGIRSDVN
jgi:hypothetical protein